MLAQADARRLREARPEDSFQPIPASQLLRPPPLRDWMVERCFTRGTVALVAGDGGIGKSLLMQQLLTCCVLGLPFLGLATKIGRGLLFACEDDGDELHRRQDSINRALDRPMEDVIEGGLYLYGRVGFDNTLARLERKEWRMQATALMTRLTERCLEHGITYVALDTATQVFSGNQNDEQQVVQFINMCRRLAVLIQGVVILTKHPSLSGRALGTGESGNTAWSNSVRSRFYLHREKDKGLVWAARKSNYGPADMEIPLEWRRGSFVSLAQDNAPSGRWGYADA